MAFQKWGSHTFSVRPFTRVISRGLTPRQQWLLQEGLNPFAGRRAPSTASIAPAVSTTSVIPQLSPKIEQLYKEAMGIYEPGGVFGKGVEAALKRARTKAVASGMQALVSAGLAGTTLPAGLGKKFEEEIGMPTRARVEEARAQGLSGLKVGLAQALQRSYETAQERALREQLARMSQSTALQQAMLSSVLRPIRTISVPESGYSRPGFASVPRRQPISLPLGSNIIQPWSPPTSDTSTIKMGPGYGPAFQSAITLAEIAKKRLSVSEAARLEDILRQKKLAEATTSGYRTFGVSGGW